MSEHPGTSEAKLLSVKVTFSKMLNLGSAELLCSYILGPSYVWRE